MWWTQCFVFIIVFVNLQDAQSENLDLQEYLKGEIDGMVSACGKVKNDEDVKPAWNDLVNLATSKVIDSLTEMLSKEKTPLTNFSDDNEVIEHFQQAGSLQAFENKLEEAYSVLNAFCNDKTGIAPRAIPLIVAGLVARQVALKVVPLVARGVVKHGPEVVREIGTGLAILGIWEGLKHGKD